MKCIRVGVGCNGRHGLWGSYCTCSRSMVWYVYYLRGVRGAKFSLPAKSFLSCPCHFPLSTFISTSIATIAPLSWRLLHQSEQDYLRGETIGRQFGPVLTMSSPACRRWSCSYSRVVVVHRGEGKYKDNYHGQIDVEAPKNLKRGGSGTALVLVHIVPIATSIISISS